MEYSVHVAVHRARGSHATDSQLVGWLSVALSLLYQAGLVLVYEYVQSMEYSYGVPQRITAPKSTPCGSIREGVNLRTLSSRG